MRLLVGLLGSLGAVALAAPAQANELLYWQFEQDQRKLTFRTVHPVRPQAQLVTSPSRIAIDLPGIQLGQPTVRETVPGVVREVRIGQFKPQTARLVIELKPGYTLDPQQIQIRGATPQHWSVTLPEPQRVGG
ncbi:MAG: hypothetical protein BRC58_04780 [Cyanobacteria bacterium QS_8_64_29]|nr:MAG: hypothetical protein BRC58_04780 [Cyanobacteria bacterium QS_8_64_29]